VAWGGVKGDRRDLAALFLAHPTTVGDRVIASGVCERTGEGEGSCSLRSDAGDECSRQKQSHEHSRSSVQGRRSEAQVVQVGDARGGALQTRSLTIKVPAPCASFFYNYVGCSLLGKRFFKESSI
jgi:hypothetical protein